MSKLEAILIMCMNPVKELNALTKEAKSVINKILFLIWALEERTNTVTNARASDVCTTQL